MFVDPPTVISVMGVTLLGLGGILALLPVGTCGQCAHCRLEKLARERKRDDSTGRIYGLPVCGTCGLRHGPDEDHPSERR